MVGKPAFEFDCYIDVVNCLVGSATDSSRLEETLMAGGSSVGIPEAPRGTPDIRVTFAVDQYCGVTVTATLNNSDLKVKGTIKNQQKYLTPQAIKAALSRAEADKIEDQQQVSVIEARQSAESAMAEAASVLSTALDRGSDTGKIDERVAALGLALDAVFWSAFTWRLKNCEKHSYQHGQHRLTFCEICLASRRPVSNRKDRRNRRRGTQRRQTLRQLS